MEQPRVLEDHAEGAAQVVAGHLARVDAVDRDPAAVDLVEAHQQVDERRLAGARRADDRDRAARLGHEVQVLDERRVRLGSGTRRPRRRPRRGRRASTLGATGSAITSASSSSSKTRSADATADWRTLAMLAVWMIGHA